MNFIGILLNRIEESEVSIVQVIAGPVLSLRALPVAAMTCVVKIAVIVDKVRKLWLRFWSVVINLVVILTTHLVLVPSAVRAMTQEVFA